MNGQSSGLRGLRVALVIVITIVALLVFAAPAFRDIVGTLNEVRNHRLCNLEPPSRCEFPLVYNKPPKTASTKIRDDLSTWSKAASRRVYRCSPYTRQATFQMRECVPHNHDGCAIVATHMKLSVGLRDLLKSRIGDFRLLTSTRDPAHRIFSMFLQVTRTSASEAFRNKTILQDYVSEYNPWDLYNYHSGEGREGSCPLSLQDVAIITDLVNRADIVIDADLRDVSNAILNYANLFQLSDSVLNRKTSEDRNFTMFDERTKDLVKSVSCVEDEMHRMFRLRMASMYQKATGVKCLSNSRYPVPTCF